MPQLKGKQIKDASISVDKISNLPKLIGDMNLVANTTTSEGQLATTNAITYDTISEVIVRVNGMGYTPARNQSEKVTSACYFSDDGGGAVAEIGSLTGGVSKLYWNGSIAGFQLEAIDVIDFIYEG